MTQSTQERNKTLVLQAFDLLFNKRDYAAAEKYWSPHYIQHSAHIAPGREGLFDLVKSLPPTFKYEPGTIVADGAFLCLRSASPPTLNDFLVLAYFDVWRPCRAPGGLSAIRK